MITVSSNFNNAMTQTVRNWDAIVTIQRIGDVMAVDISDRILSMNITQDFERRNSILELQLDNYDYELSPLNKNSSLNKSNAGVHDPLLDGNKRIVVKIGIQVADGSYEYVTRFTGVLGDEIDAESYPGTVQLTVRDFSKILQDTYVFHTLIYMPRDFTVSGNTVTVQAPVQLVIQDVINHSTASGNNIQLQSLDDPKFMIGYAGHGWSAENQNCWDIIQSLADASSHELRFLEDGTLILRKVVRDFSVTGNTASLVLDESSIIRDQISVNDSDVRNYIFCRLQTGAVVSANCIDSIGRYGIRYYQIDERITPLIPDATYAKSLCNAILYDLAYPMPIDNVEIPLNPTIQVADFVAINNSKLGTNSTDDIFKVIRVTDIYSKDQKRTQLQLRGKTSFIPTLTPKPHPPSGLSIEVKSRIINNYIGSGWSGNRKVTYYPLLQWTSPTTDISGNTLNNDFGGYMVYRQYVSGGTFADWNPDTTIISSGNTVWVQIASIPSYISSINKNIDYFYDYTSNKGQNNTYKIVAINKEGVRSSDSNTATIVVPNDTIL